MPPIKGGFIGSRGERDDDAVPVRLAPGEIITDPERARQLGLHLPLEGDEDRRTEMPTDGARIRRFAKSVSVSLLVLAAVFGGVILAAKLLPWWVPWVVLAIWFVLFLRMEWKRSNDESFRS